MGWTSLRRERGISDKQFFEKEWGLASLNREIVAYNSSSGFAGEFYAAVRDNNTGQVYAMCVLKTWDARHYYNFSFKEMSEDSGPGYYNASRKVLNALTHTDNVYANQWREQVNKTLEKMEQTRQVPVGAVIKFPEPVKFTSGATVDTFRIAKGRKLEYLTPYGSFRPCNFRGWKERTFEVISS